jgi:hypothetical protein
MRDRSLEPMKKNGRSLVGDLEMRRWTDVSGALRSSQATTGPRTRLQIISFGATAWPRHESSGKHRASGSQMPARWRCA